MMELLLQLFSSFITDIAIDPIQTTNITRRLTSLLRMFTKISVPLFFLLFHFIELPFVGSISKLEFDFEVFLIPRIKVLFILVCFVEEEHFMDLCTGADALKLLFELSLHPLWVDVLEQQGVGFDAFVLLGDCEPFDFEQHVGVEEQQDDKDPSPQSPQNEPSRLIVHRRDHILRGHNPQPELKDAGSLNLVFLLAVFVRLEQQHYRVH
jgi:hypothetical protein